MPSDGVENLTSAMSPKPIEVDGQWTRHVMPFASSGHGIEHSSARSTQDAHLHQEVTHADLSFANSSLAARPSERAARAIAMPSR